MDSVTVAQSLTGLDSFFTHLIAAFALMALFCLIYVRVTPYPEFRLIREGNVAPAMSFSGAFLGFVAPLFSAIATSVSFTDMVIWALVALVVQILVFLILRILFTGLSADVADNKTAPAILLGVISLAAGLVNAACMIY
jgi:putative membrane protein